MNLLIVGAGDHGRCCLEIARDMNIFDKISFLDDNHVNEIINGCLVIGSVDEMSSYYPEYTHIHIAICNNKVRSKLLKQAKEIGYSLPILQHSSSIVSKYATIDGGSVLFPRSVVEANAEIKQGCIIFSNVVINHDVVIEDYCLIYSNTVIKPNSLIGSLSRIGSNCTITFGTKVKSNSNIKDGSVIEPTDEYSFEVGV